MTTTNEKLRNVAEIAAKIMMGEKALHPNQQKLDVHEPEKDELTADDFKKLRAKKEEVKKEEVEELDELKKSTLGSYIRKAATDAVDRTAQEIETGEMDKLADKRMKGIKTATKKLSKEEVEELDEVKMADLPSRKVQARAYGAYKPEPHAVDTLAGPKTKELKSIEAEKPIKKDPKNYVKDTGQKRNYKVHAGRYFSNLDTGVSSKGLEEPRYKNESFANILASYSEGGLKGLFETLNQNKVIIEEPTSAEFDAEIKVAQDKSQGKGKKAEVAKPAVQAVQNEEYDVLDYNEVNGVRISEIDLEESSDDYEVKQDKKDPDVHHVHYKDKKIGYVYGNKKGMFGHEYHAMGTGDDGYSSKKQAVNAVKADHKYHMSGDYLKERTLTEPEMKKKEEIVKSMKKGMKGFKERYGERAKEVMYATATKQAMKD